MDQASPEKKRRKPRILVAPLDWGLGHATRCIPVIRELLKQDCAVYLAGEGHQEALLRNEFSQLPFVPLKGYRIHYSKTSLGLFSRLLWQVPKIKKAIRHEHDRLNDLVKEFQLDAVISDNRYGLHHNSIPCVFVTHQLQIKTYGGGWPERVLRKKNFSYIEKFSECWVPDNADKSNLAGKLSHPDKNINIPLKYIGPLSRFEKSDTGTEKGHLLFLISGPEPQRTIFENIIIKQLGLYEGRVTVIRGLPSGGSSMPSTSTIRIFNHLPADELASEMKRAEYIIARSGYSTIMDIVRMKKKSILIPTPGQTEQAYLAGYLSEKGLITSCSQKEFSLQKAIGKAGNFSYRFIDEDNRLSSAISDLIRSLQ